MNVHRRSSLRYIAAAIAAAALFAIARTSSGVSSAGIKTARDIPYIASGGDPVLNTLDVYSPSGAHGAPVVVFIHGGGWKRGDKSTGASEKSQALPEHGYVFISINYRLAPSVKYPAMAKDCAKAISWIHANIGKYGGDPNSIFIMGHSAGAHLSALLCTDTHYLTTEGVPMKSIRGCIPLDGEYNLTMDGPRPRIVESIVSGAFGDDPAARKDASPLYHIATGKGIPPFLIIPVAWRIPSVKQSNDLAAALQQANVQAKVAPAEGKTHATLNRAFGEDGDLPTQETYAFIDGIMGVRH